MLNHSPYTWEIVWFNSHSAYQMKVLLLSCKHFNTKIKKLATRPEGIKPEPVNKKEYFTDKSIVVLITVEKNDDLEDILNKLIDDIKIFSKDTGIKTIVLFPFGHLSNNLASSEETVGFLDLLENKLTNEFEIVRIHFGSHKSLMLDVFGHQGNVRFREF